MPFFGELCCVPLRLGGEAPVTEVVLESLNDQLGSGYNTDVDSIVYLLNLAFAQAIASAWLLNEVIASQGNPLQLSMFLEREEKMMSLPFDPTLTIQQRRERIREVQSRAGEAVDYQFVSDNLSRILGPLYVATEFISPSVAVVHVPDGSYPWGTVVPGIPWYSTVAHMLVRTQKPYGWSEGRYRETLGAASKFLNESLPVHMTFTLYHPPEGHTPTNVPGGPSAGGFNLDTNNSLDYCVFP